MLAAVNWLLEELQMPLTLRPPPMNSAAEAIATKEIRSVYSIRSWPDSSARKSSNCSMEKAWNKVAARENSSMDSSSILSGRAKGTPGHPSHCRGGWKMKRIWAADGCAVAVDPVLLVDL